ncbi:hypothetical protein EAH68_06810 [Corynebacterium hylobatis]|uniref:ChsH2 C-terminal OB-fold domain-containing protein n=1 Tax=Corynebacterium hylobatis TaxID=1859290 RepID=A0A430HYZ9_9CORY|nr:OB-fold domain-containing protein [Corynebacterium hylobatis]RSZ63934.1 hypothetical protein EAH68_06810 [Corynebacterium hylobatis]
MSAVIHTYTIVRTPPQGFDGAPYCVAIIDVDGQLETARVSGYVEGTEINIGDHLHRLEQPDEFGAVYALQ